MVLSTQSPLWKANNVYALVRNEFCFLYERNVTWNWQQRKPGPARNINRLPILCSTKWIYLVNCLNCLKLYHKYKNQELPNFFNNMFTTNADIHTHHTRRRNDLHHFSYNTEGASKRIRHAVPNIINELTPLVREKLSTLNLEQFTNYYKSFIIDSYEVTCRIHQCYICNRQLKGIYWGKVVNLSVNWPLNEYMVIFF